MGNGIRRPRVAVRVWVSRPLQAMEGDSRTWVCAEKKSRRGHRPGPFEGPDLLRKMGDPVNVQRADSQSASDLTRSLPPPCTLLRCLWLALSFRFSLLTAVVTCIWQFIPRLPPRSLALNLPTIVYPACAFQVRETSKWVQSQLRSA